MKFTIVEGDTPLDVAKKLNLLQCPVIWGSIQQRTIKEEEQEKEVYWIMVQMGTVV